MAGKFGESRCTAEARGYRGRLWGGWFRAGSVLGLALLIPVTSAGNRVVKLSDLLEEARSRNPVLAAARQRVAAYEARVPQAGALDDPRVGFEALNLPVDDPAFDRTPMSGFQVRLSQRFPFPGKLGFRKEAARRQAESARQDYVELENEILSKVEAAFYDLQFVLKDIEITTRNKELLESFSRIAEAKYALGEGIQQDVLKAQVELSRVLDRLLQLRQEKRTAEARLNTLLDRDPGRPVGALEPIDTTRAAIDAAALQRLALEKRPLLRSLRERVSSLEALYGLARKDYYPDFDLAFGYRFRDNALAGDPVKGADFLTLSVSFNLPVYFGSKQSEKVTQVAAEVGAAQSRLQAAANEVVFTIEDLAATLGRLGRQIDLYDTGILPQAEQSLESAASGYQVDKVDFLTLLDNQVTLYNLQIEHFRLLTEYQKNLAKLHWAVGTDEWK